MQQRSTVAVYARISQDRDGTALGVARQLADCRAAAERRGWTVAEEYVDDDVSAYSGKVRPAWTRMLADIAAGRRDAVIVWDLDRLHRRPIDLEHFLAACDGARVRDLVTWKADLDLTNGDALTMVRVMAAFAHKESHDKSRRGQRKMQELAEAGKPHGGGTRPFGFDVDKVTHRPDEAAVIRELAARALAGESVTSLARWLDEAEVRTVTGKVWRPQVLRQLLINPRIYGMRSHNGEALHPATWEPIISSADGERLRVLLTDPARRTNRTARRYLLSGLCRCGKCGSKMLSVPRFETRRYLCRSSTGFDGCGGTAITAEHLERFIAEAVLHRLDSPALQQGLAGRQTDDGEASRLSESIAKDTAQLGELAEMWADGEINRADWRKARGRIEARMASSRSALARATQTSALDGLVGNGEELRQRWATLNLTRQVAIIKAVLDHVIVKPAAVPGRRGFDPARVEPVWRL